MRSSHARMENKSLRNQTNLKGSKEKKKILRDESITNPRDKEKKRKMSE